MPIKSFRGLMLDGTQDTISLHTNTGTTGYRIIKMQIIGEDPGNTNVEATIKVYSILQTAVDGKIDFSDNTLLAAGHHAKSTSVSGAITDIVVFDNMTFNQDIYVTCDTGSTTGVKCNYHIELEQVSLDLNENTMATLKDIRNIASQ